MAEALTAVGLTDVAVRVSDPLADRPVITRGENLFLDAVAIDVNATAVAALGAAAVGSGFSYEPATTTYLRRMGADDLKGLLGSVRAEQVSRDIFAAAPGSAPPRR